MAVAYGYSLWIEADRQRYDLRKAVGECRAPKTERCDQHCTKRQYLASSNIHVDAPLSPNCDVGSPAILGSFGEWTETTRRKRGPVALCPWLSPDLPLSHA